MPNSLRPHGLQHATLPYPSPSPRVFSNSCPLSQWCHQTILSSVITTIFTSLTNKSMEKKMQVWLKEMHVGAKLITDGFVMRNAMCQLDWIMECSDETSSLGLSVMIVPCEMVFEWVNRINTLSSPVWVDIIQSADCLNGGGGDWGRGYWLSLSAFKLWHRSCAVLDWDMNY